MPSKSTEAVLARSTRVLKTSCEDSITDSTIVISLCLSPPPPPPPHLSSSYWEGAVEAEFAGALVFELCDEQSCVSNRQQTSHDKHDIGCATYLGQHRGHKNKQFDTGPTNPSLQQMYFMHVLCMHTHVTESRKTRTQPVLEIIIRKRVKQINIKKWRGWGDFLVCIYPCMNIVKTTLLNRVHFQKSHWGRRGGGGGGCSSSTEENGRT